jgi:hypothetical protein
MEVSCEFHSPTALPPGKITRYPSHGRLGGGGGTRLSYLCRESKRDFIMIQTVAQSLYRLVAAAAVFS